jgi:hypothetical protein
MTKRLFYFYSPEYGMILERSIVWGNYIRLTDIGNCKKLDQIIYQLTLAIQADEEFFTEGKIIEKLSFSAFSNR